MYPQTLKIKKNNKKKHKIQIEEYRTILWICSQLPDICNLAIPQPERPLQHCHMYTRNTQNKYLIDEKGE